MISKKRKTAFGWASSTNGSLTDDQRTSPETLLPSLEQLTEGPSEALQNGAYNEAIDQSSQWIDALLKQAVGLLKVRNAAWNKKANLTEQLRDTLRMIEFSPLDAEGYCSAAAIYSTQGKQQDAITTLQKALDVPVTDDQRIFIQQQIETAKQRLERRVDFIVESPHNIFSSILQHIDGDTAMKCIEVCHVWRDRILLSPIPWRTAGTLMKGSSGSHHDSKTYTLLPIISRHVEELHLAGLSAGKTALCIDMARTHLFSRLRSLHIKNIGEYTEVGDLSVYLYNALPYIALSLTTLEIVESKSTIISIGCIVSICRNLVNLRCDVYSIADCHGDGIPISHPTALTEIHLESRATAITNVQQLIQFSPHLELLQLNHYEGDILPVIKDHCPQLISIVINMELFQEPEVRAFKESKNLRPEQAKLQCLTLPGVRSAQALLPHLQRGTDSLRLLLLEPNCEGSTRVDWLPLTSFPLPKVSCINLRTAHTSAVFFECLPVMIRCCPNLDSFKLIGGVGDEENQESRVSMATTNKIFDAVAELSTSQKQLEFSHFDLRGTSFIRLLQQYNGSSGRFLHNLLIKKCKGVTADTLQAIGKIHGLRVLSICGAEEQVSVSDVTEFSKAVSEMKTLLFLELCGMKFNDDAAHTIAHTKNSSLTTVTVPHESELTQEGKSMLARRFGYSAYVFDE